mmetsp:Transcript_46067/g.120686  ORF Transcript_46067/g.120686 Transcript_46067/m.120686 type:complete len:226 (+) Transcript_46067:66-743(+)
MIAMPSSSALCASIAPRTTSPMAQMPGTLVAKCSSISTCPRPFTFTPMFSRPRPSVTGARPVDTSTMSASIVSGLSPLTESISSLAPPDGSTSAEFTFVDSLNFIPCFLKIRSSAVDVSLSIGPPMPSMNSTTVTSAPRRRHTEPISRPMTPPPTTTIFFGTSVNSSAPVDVTIVFSSTGTPGSFAGSDPVAITMFFVVSVGASPPSIGWHLTEPAARISPVPLK